MQCNREGKASADASLRSPGCNIYGHVEVNKVAGNLHIAPGKSFQANHMHIHDINAFIAKGEACVGRGRRPPSRERAPVQRRRPRTDGARPPCVAEGGGRGVNRVFDMGHVEDRLSFGDDFPNIVNPLDNKRHDQRTAAQMRRHGRGHGR